jgi:hypothetical protein
LAQVAEIVKAFWHVAIQAFFANQNVRILAFQVTSLLTFFHYMNAFSQEIPVDLEVACDPIQVVRPHTGFVPRTLGAFGGVFFTISLRG